MPAKLTRLEHPFRTDQRRLLELEDGVSLRDSLGPGTWVVHRNGMPVAPDELATLRVAPGDIVTARLVPGVEGVIAGIAALGKFVASYYTIISTVVSLAYSGYSAYTSYRASRKENKQGQVASQPFYAVFGASNQLRPFGAIPQHYGTLTVVPDLLLPTISAISDSAVQTVQNLFCIGRGFYSPVELASIKLGEQPITSLGVTDFAAYDGLSDPGDPDELLARYFVNTIEEPLGLELRHVANEGSVAQVRTTQENAQAFDVQVVFAQGVTRIAADGKQRPTSITLRIRYREVGETDWILTLERFIVGFIPQKFAINHHVEPAATGQFEVEVKLIATEPFAIYPADRNGGGQSLFLTGDAVWTSLRSYLFGQTVIDEEAEGLTMFGLAIEASELVNGTLDRVAIECTRMLPTWTEEDGWSAPIGGRDPAGYTATNNPAWAYANELRDSGVPDDEIDAAQIKAWADFCDEQGWECNLPYNDEQVLEDSLLTIASCGQAFPTMKGSAFSVVFDAPREPVAAFGPLNMRDLVVSQQPLERVDAIQARFSNADASGRLDERIVYLDGHTEDTAEVYRTADVLNGLTDPVLVERFIRLERLKAQRRTVGYTWKADWSAIVCEVGDVVVLQHYGAILGDDVTTVDSYSTKNAGAHIDEVFIHPAVRVEAGRTYGLRVRTRAEGASGGFHILTLPITNPLTVGVQKLSALTVTGNVAVPTYTDDAEVEHTDTLEGQLAFFGEPTDGLVMITEVKINKDGSCDLQGVDFAPELFDEALLETVFEPTVSSSALALAPPPTPVLAPPVLDPTIELPTEGNGGGTVYTRIATIGDVFYTVEYVVTLAPSTAFPPVVRYQVQYRYNFVEFVNEWVAIADVPAPAAQIIIGPVTALGPVDIRIYAVSSTGVRSAPLLIEDVQPTQEAPLPFAIGFAF